MKKIEKKDIWLFIAQVAVWVIIITALPLATFLSTQDAASAKTSLHVAWGLFRAPMEIYFANFYILGPRLFFRRHYWAFAIINLIIITGVNFQFFAVWWWRNDIPNMPAMTPEMWIGFFSGFIMFLVFNIVIIGMTALSGVVMQCV